MKKDMKKIAIVSGKGGVGKSSITASIALIFKDRMRTVCADCDVDASNLALVLGAGEPLEKQDIKAQDQAVIDHDKCTLCGRCRDICYFDALGWDAKPYIKEFGCEGCGLCELVCPNSAISIQKIENATITVSLAGVKLISGQLKIGSSGSGKVVSEVKKRAEQEHADLMLIDSAAGIGCPVIASISGADHVLAVTEPTPSGFSDLKRVLKVADHFRIPYSIILNKSDLNQGFAAAIRKFAGDRLIKEIPYDKAWSEALSAMRPIIIHKPAYTELFKDIVLSLEKKVFEVR